MAPEATHGVQAVVDDERGVAKWARWAAVGYAIGMLSGPLLLWRLQPIFRGIWEGTLDPAQVQQLSESAAAGWTQIPGWVQTVSFIVLLVWIYRAALAARRLGIPARRSPGWAVGAWFVPVVNLWWPCQSLRDLLPAGNPYRSRITMLWITAILGGVVSAVGMGMLVFGSSSGLALALVGSLVVAGTLIAGRAVITEVLRVHEDVAARTTAETATSGGAS